MCNFGKITTRQQFTIMVKWFDLLWLFLLSAFLRNCFLCRDRIHGNVQLWLGAALLGCLRASIAWGLYPDLSWGLCQLSSSSQWIWLVEFVECRRMIHFFIINLEWKFRHLYFSQILDCLKNDDYSRKIYKTSVLTWQANKIL